MKWRLLVLGSTILAVCFVIACSRTAHAELVIEVPANYNGPVTVQMGVSGAPALRREGDALVISVPSTGRLSTSTTLPEVTPEFKNVDRDRIWGYENSVLRTGDGIPVVGSIDFFVGTKEQYQVELTKKHKSSIRDLQEQNLLSAMGTATLASL